MNDTQTYIVVIDGQGETHDDFSVLFIDAADPFAAVEAVVAPEMGYGRREDGVAYVFPVEAMTAFSVNDTTRKSVALLDSVEVISAGRVGG